MLATPKNFRFNAEEKDKRTIELFNEIFPYRVQCPECEGRFFRKIFENGLRELLENFSGSSNHLIDQIDSYRDLRYWECPACHESVSLQKPKRNHNEKTSNIKGGSK